MEKVVFFVLVTMTVLTFNQCTKQKSFHKTRTSNSNGTGNDSGSDSNSRSDSDSAAGEESSDINQLKNPKPEVVCGESGYEYLMEEYLFENCVGCHAQNGFAQPPLADRDLTLSYEAALPVAKNKFLEAISENPLCGDCNLETTGEVYQAIEEWIDNRFKECD